MSKITEKLQIRSYREDDEPAVVQLWQTVFPGSPAWNDPRTDIRRKLAVQRQLFFVALIGSELVGTAMAGFDGHRGWVYYLGVAPEYRRQGIGTALMAQVERGLIGIGCPKLNLQVRATNEVIVAFYKGLGYAIEERISMAKRLEGVTGDS
jgi:ribosomal protein S18 acetylase RimI-like enzyme